MVLRSSRSRSRRFRVLILRSFQRYNDDKLYFNNILFRIIRECDIEMFIQFLYVAAWRVFGTKNKRARARAEGQIAGGL